MYSALSTIRENSIENKWKFQGQEHQTDFDLNWYAFKWRMHNPEIGRFMVIDSLSEDYYYNSPYAFSENDVISAIELEGLEKIRITNYSKLQSEKIKSHLDVKKMILATPVSLQNSRVRQLERIKNMNQEVRRITAYGSENGFSDNYMTNRLEESGIEVPDAVKEGEKTTIKEELDSEAELSIEIYGVLEDDEGKLKMGKLGEYNPSKETDQINMQGGAYAVKLFTIGLIEYLMNKGVPVELPSVVTEDKKESQ